MKGPAGAGAVEILDPNHRLYQIGRELSDEQAEFLDHYLLTFDERAAAAHLGITLRKARMIRGSKLVAEAIGIALQQRTDKLQITRERVAQEIAKVAFANMGDYLQNTPDGDPRIDLSKLNVDQQAAIKRVKVSDVVEDRGEEGQRTVRKVEFELHDKLEALSQLGRYQGMFVDKKEITLTLEARVANMSREERLERMRAILEPMRQFLTEMDEAERSGEIIEQTQEVGE
jgi:phage terminase small subunit